MMTIPSVVVIWVIFQFLQLQSCNLQLYAVFNIAKRLNEEVVIVHKSSTIVNYDSSVRCKNPNSS